MIGARPVSNADEKQAAQKDETDHESDELARGKLLSQVSQAGERSDLSPAAHSCEFFWHVSVLSRG